MNAITRRSAGGSRAIQRIEVTPRTDPPPAAPPATRDDDQVRRRAYEIYLARTRAGIPGDALSDWLQAERQVSAPPRTVPPPDGRGRSRSRGETLLAGDMEE
jgi:hypothetical protein